MGNMGIACEGIEIYLPLTPHLTLALLCRTIAATMELASKQLSTFVSFEADRFLTALVEGKPFLLSPSRIQRLNALQVFHSERFLIGSVAADFEIATKMIEKDDKYRRGPKQVH